MTAAESHALSAWAQRHLPITADATHGTHKHFGGARGPLRDILPFAHLKAGEAVRPQCAGGEGRPVSPS